MYNVALFWVPSIQVMNELCVCVCVCAVWVCACVHVYCVRVCMCEYYAYVHMTDCVCIYVLALKQIFTLIIIQQQPIIQLLFKVAFVGQLNYIYTILCIIILSFFIFKQYLDYLVLK